MPSDWDCGELRLVLDGDYSQAAPTKRRDCLRCE